MPYRAPVSELLAALRSAAEGDRGAYPEFWDGTAEAILDQAATMAHDLLVPLDRIGDREGVRLGPDGVTTAPGWAAAYQSWIAGGWNGVAAPEEAGGMGLSLLLNAASFEIWSGANMAFALAPLLTAGAIEALHRHGSPELKRLFLPQLVSGAWTGTMNLTEPQAGSDLSGLRTKAERQPDGRYRITGQKIYITYGDHDLTENILHLVLARLTDAPPGTRGISLFLVPKFLVDADGRLGARNDLRCIGLERKLGIHAAPTCTMAFGGGEGALGYLVGEENKGLACMFTMMNNARLTVGLEGVAAAEQATQKAIAFARERKQGRASRDATDHDPIIAHPDVARMLMTMKASTAAARAICYRTATALDGARRGDAAAAERAALLTPVAKAYATDIGHEVASLGVQVHGGLGFIEDAGAAQILRDVRITSIYEGTNGIQAIDLVQRKLPLRDGAVVADEIAAMRRILVRLSGRDDPRFGRTAEHLDAAVDALDRATAALRSATRDAPATALAGATSYLRLFALALGGTALAAAALDVRAEAQPNAPDSALVLCRFFAENLAPAAIALDSIATHGGAALAEQPDAWSAALVTAG